MRYLLLLGLLGCLSPTAPCPTEIRQVALIGRYTTVCLPTDTAGLQVCATWPPMPADSLWMGSADSLVAHGIPLRDYTVCQDVPITLTVLSRPCHSSASYR